MLTVRFDQLGVQRGRPRCSTWAAGPAATPSSRSAAAPASWPSTTRPPSSRTSAACSPPCARPARPAPSRARWRPPPTATPSRLPFPDDTFDRIIASEVLEHVPDDQRAARRDLPGAQARRHARRHRAAWLPEQICWALSDEYHAPFVEGGHVRIFTEPTLRAPDARRRPAAGRRPPRPRPALAVLVAEVRGRPHQRRPPAREGVPPGPPLGHRPDAAHGHAHPLAERLLNPVLGKSLVVYATQADGKGLSRMPIDVPGLVSATDLHATVDGIAEWQLPSGMIPWFPGGHADPWNHVEAAMALDLGGRRREADRAYEWLVDLQRADGSWHQYYVAGDDGRTQVEQDKLDANVVRLRRRRRLAPLAAHRRPRLRRDAVAGRRAGHRLRARPPDPARRDPLGPPRRRHPVDLRPAHRLVVDLPQPALRHRPRRAARPRAPRLGALRRPAGPRDPRRARRLRPQAPLGHGLVLPGARRRRARRRRPRPASTSAATRSSSTAAACAACPTARGSPWPRPASAPWPTSPSATASTAETLFGWAQQFRHDDDGRYWTGTVFPDEARFPGGERSTYTAASVVLAADALAGSTPASALFVETAAVLPPLMDLPDA